MFIPQKHSNYGSSTPVVARTVLQGREVLQFIGRAETEKESALSVLLELQRHLLKCVEIRDDLASEVAKGQSEFLEGGMATRSIQHIVSPGVGDLHSKAESFLQSAKLAIAATGNLIAPFYEHEYGYKYNKICLWADKEFGIDDAFSTVLRSWKPFVGRIVNMRNCVEHPKSGPGARLIVANFTLANRSATFGLVDPAWGLTGESPHPILPSFETIIEQTICLGENVLAGIFYKLRASVLVVLEEIPLDQRDEACPKRLRVSVQQGRP